MFFMYLSNNMQLQGGKYKICKFLGQGGFGITYQAVQSGLERYVAIKEFFIKELCARDESTSYVTLATEGSRETVDRFRVKFLKEARNIAKLNHPNIVRIIDVFEENGTAYYVMEYCGGGSLAEKVKKQGYLSEPVATRYILQIADALNYIHNKKMNHFDVKPSNIMLNEKDEPILIDFGLSKEYDVITGNQTSTTPIGISEGYAPMEQYMQEGVGSFSPETDIYSLGATYYKLLTGITPPNASYVNNEGLPIDELKRKGISQNAIDVILSSMEARKKFRMNNVLLFVDGLKGTKEYSYENVSTETENEDTITNSQQSDMYDVNDNSNDNQDVVTDSDSSERNIIMTIAVLILGLCLLLFVFRINIVKDNKASSTSMSQPLFNNYGKTSDSLERNNTLKTYSSLALGLDSDRKTPKNEILNNDVCGIYEVTSNMFVREGPGTDYDTMYSDYNDKESNNTNGVVVFAGSRIKVMKEENGFVYAKQLTPENDRDNWEEGWISKKYLKKISNE